MLSRFLPLSLLASPALTHEIVWKPSCPPEITSLNPSLPIVCGSLQVPLDYTNVSSTKTLDLHLYKIAVANGTQSKHSVLLNFGGPGNDGLNNFSMNSSALQLLLGGDHDMILVNPRGTGANFDFSCSQNKAEGALQASWTSMNGNASDVAPGQLWATTGLYAEACKQSSGAANGDLIGTAFTARDFMQVAEALHEDGLIYYQGFSYGTVLGMTIAALFPNKVGRMVLDGNVNPYQYYRNSYVDYYIETDEVFSLFCSTCVATPQLCAIARNQSSAELESELLALFDRLKYHPLPASFPNGQGALVDYSWITNSFLSALYEPITWPTLSVILADLLESNTTLIPESGLITTSGPDVLSGIRCSDNRVRVSDPGDLAGPINVTEAESPIFGGTSVSFYYTCAQWPFLAKGNFSWPAGPLPIHTEAPVLLIGNLHDPVTPLANAKSNSAALKGSVALQHDGVGHTTFYSQGSLCTARTIYNYWRNGTLPPSGMSCPIQTPIFSLDNGWETVLKELAREVGGTYS